MRELTLNANKPKLKINGIVFDVRLSDAEIMAMGTDVQNACAGIDPKDTHKVLETARYLASCIDRVLGDGAVKTISDGAPVSVKRMVEWFGIITDNALAAQFDKMVEDND